MNSCGKVIHVVRQLHYGGVEKQVATILKNRDLSAFDHEVVCITDGSDTLRELQQSGASVYVIRAQSSIPSPITIFKLYRYFRKVRPLVVHTRGAEANFHGAIAALLAKVNAVVCEEIGFPNHSKKARCVFRWIYGRANVVISVSRAVRDYIVSIGEASQKKIAVLYNPVNDPSARANLDFSEGLKIGFVGRLEPVKNPVNLLKGVAKAIESGIPCSCKVVGDGSQMGELRKLIQVLGIEAHVKLLGYKEKPFLDLTDCNLYIQPSRSEGFGIAIVEAMYAGLPVIATGVGGVTEFLKHDHNGFILDDTSSDGIFKSIVNFWNSEEAARRRVASDAYVYAINNFGIKSYFENCDKIYGSLLLH